MAIPELSSPEYKDAIRSLYAYADHTSTLATVNVEYAQARENLNRLDASPAEPVAKVTLPAALPPKPAKSLEHGVRSALLQLPYYGVFDYLAFQLDGDQVTLVGDVSWPVLKTDAERAVRSVEGVTSVTSEINVLPVSGHDNRLRLATYWAIYGQPNLARYRMNPHPPIRIIVENGHVTLKGVVGSEMDRSLAFLKANGVPGAFSVTNDLEIGS